MHNFARLSRLEKRISAIRQREIWKQKSARLYFCNFVKFRKIFKAHFYSTFLTSLHSILKLTLFNFIPDLTYISARYLQFWICYFKINVEGSREISGVHTWIFYKCMNILQIFSFVLAGNHESAPVNMFTSHNAPHESWTSRWLYNALASSDGWRRWLPATDSTLLDDIQRVASYSVLAERGFRIISINMNYCNQMNFWMYMNTTDPDNMLQWLQCCNQLQRAEDNHELVHIIGHVPPGQCMQVTIHMLFSNFAHSYIHSYIAFMHITYSPTNI